MTRTNGAYLLAVGLGALLGAAAAAPLGAQEADSPGREAFISNKCNLCHSVEALGIERTSTSDKMMAMDLSTVGDDLEIEWALKFIKKEVEREGELHKKTFKGTDEEAQQLAAWLVTLKSPE